MFAHTSLTCLRIAAFCLRLCHSIRGLHSGLAPTGPKCQNRYDYVLSLTETAFKLFQNCGGWVFGHPKLSTLPYIANDSVAGPSIYDASQLGVQPEGAPPNPSLPLYQGFERIDIDVTR
jgi:hypothetical protein